jgi:hypothetical protein
MLNVFKYLDLPEIPAYLLPNINTVEIQKNVYHIDVPFYKQFEISTELNDFLKSIFKFKFVAHYQIIKTGIPIHKDKSRVECINYLINNGGEDSCLKIYQEDKKSILFKEHIENFKWHWIDVSKFHSVSGLTNNSRFSLSVTPLL